MIIISKGMMMPRVIFWQANISLMNERVKLENEVDDDT